MATHTSPTGAPVSDFGGTKYELPNDMFADDHLHKQFQGFSVLNTELDKLVGRRGRGSAIDEIAEQQSNFRALYNHLQDVNTNLLVREKEVICVVLVSTNSAPIQEPANPNVLTTVIQPHIVIAANPRKDDFVAEGNKMRVEGKLPTALDTSQGVITAVLQKYQTEGKQVLFDEHVGWFIGLLKGCHTADLDSASYKEATTKFRQYVYLVSHPKMKQRLDIGKEGKKGNFYSILTTKVSGFPSGKLDENDIKPNLANIKPTQDQQKFIRDFIYSFDGDERQQTASAEQHCNAPLYDIEGRKFFHEMLASLVEDVNNAITAINDKSNALNRADWQLADGDVLEMTDLVDRVQWATQYLNNFIALFGKQPFGPQLTPPAKCRDLLTMHLLWLAQVAGVKNRRDTPFPATSPAATPQADPVPASAVQISAPTQAASSLSGTPSAQSAPAAVPPVSLESYQQYRTAGNDDVDADIDASSDDSEPPEPDTTGGIEDDAEMADQVDRLCDSMNELNADGSGWAAAVTKFLELICLHEHGLTQACPDQQEATGSAKSQHIRHAKVTVVDIKFSEWESKRLSISELLGIALEDNADNFLDQVQLEERIAKAATDRLRKRHLDQDAKAAKLLESRRAKNTTPFAINAPPLDVKKQNKRAADIQKVQDDLLGEAKAFFNGTMHCETIIMACMILLSAPGIEAKLDDVDWLERNGIFGLRTVLLDLLRNPAPILTVSKRCCSACWTIFLRMVEQGVVKPKGTKIDAPGHHTNDPEVRLPPFLLKEYVVASVEAAKKSTLKKLRKLQNMINQERKGASDHGSQGSNPTAAAATPTSALPTPSRNLKRSAASNSYLRSKTGSQPGADTSAPAEHKSSSSVPPTPSKATGSRALLSTESSSPRAATQAGLPQATESRVRKRSSEGEDEGEGGDDDGHRAKRNTAGTADVKKPDDDAEMGGA